MSKRMMCRSLRIAFDFNWCFKANSELKKIEDIVIGKQGKVMSKGRNYLC